jgi:sugar transferase (PEP-CTERM system associated)
LPVRIFKHYINLPILLLGALEFGLLVLSTYAGVALRFGPDALFGDAQPGVLLPRALACAVAVWACLIAVGLYHVRQMPTLLGVVLRMVIAFLLGGVALALVYYAVPTLFLGRGALALSLLIAFVLIGVSRLLFSRIVDEDLFKRRVLIFGAGEKAASLLNLPHRSDMRGFKLLGFVHPRGTPLAVDSRWVIGAGQRLPDLVRRYDIDEIVVAVDDRRNGLPVHELLDCKLRGTAITDALTFFERETGRVNVDLLYPSWMIFSDGFIRNRLQAVTQRAFDVVASLVLLALTWPVMLITALAIWIESRGRDPILYRQVRIGFEGRTFEVLKFRSMRTDAEQDGRPVWAKENDDRVTRVGRVIRKYRIDELPQIFNVLRGDMSFVGPRPERPTFVEELSQKIPFYRERHSVKPGITGWAQLCYRYGSTDEDAIEKLQYDLYYVKNRSFLFDLMILLQTAEVVLWRQGAR